MLEETLEVGDVMTKFIEANEISKFVSNGQTVSVGGFLAVGTPETLIDYLIAKNIKGLTLIANDTSFPDRGVGRLVVNQQVKKAIVSHIGTNPETGKKMNHGELEVELVPQGTLAERIRCGGSGLGGVLTRTGVGTIVAQGKTIIEQDGVKYLLEKPLKADVALIKAAVADKAGNLVCRRTARNFNPVMATAAATVIAEVQRVVEAGELDPDQITIPGLYVDYICLTERRS